MSTDNYFGNVTKKTKGFYLAIAIIGIAFLMSVNTDLQFLSQSSEMQIPSEFLWIIFTVDILAILMLVLTAMFKKTGVILFPFLVLLHFLLHSFYLSTFLYFDLAALFAFFAAGLFVIVPRWKFFS